MEDTQKPKRNWTRIAKTAAAVIGGSVVGITIGVLVFKKKDKPIYVFRTTPENLQLMIDEPMSVVGWPKARVLFGNSESPEEGI